MTTDAQRETFEAAIWAYYQRLKANGWSAPEEGETTDPAALFWREPSGKYGVAQIEAAWNGWTLHELHNVDFVPFPQSEEQAVAMTLVGHAWLRQHAPHRLKGGG